VRRVLDHEPSGKKNNACLRKEKENAMKPSSIHQKTLAVLEVLLMAFAIIPLLTRGIYRLFPGFEAWQTETIGFAFPVFVDVIMVGLSVLMILLRGRRLADYGLRFTPLKYHLDVAAACFIPFVLAGFPLGMGLDHTDWGGALVMACVQIGLLFLLAWILRKKPSASSAGIVVAGAAFLLPASVALAGKAVALFLTYALFVGFGEEILYRGYMQSRLNEVFGKPYRFFGVSFGWGGILTALFFGISHVGLLGWALGLSNHITLAWGFWTFFGGLVFGFVREKTVSILAPALLHGLPQAIATVAMLFL
jgi:membrane protease YdiL (CAAX protease family)